MENTLDAASWAKLIMDPRTCGASLAAGIAIGRVFLASWMVMSSKALTAEDIEQCDSWYFDKCAELAMVGSDKEKIARFVLGLQDGLDEIVDTISPEDLREVGDNIREAVRKKRLAA